MREEQHVADARRIGKQHRKAVDADAAAACRRQAEFQSTDVVGIVVHGFIVAVGLGIGLGPKAGGLVFRIV